MVNQQKIIVGSEEWCGLSSLGVPAIKARVDSGAKTSSIHAFNMQVFKRANAPWVSFEIHPLQTNRHTTIRCEAPIVDRRNVKSSSGEVEKRYVIQAPLKIGDFEWLVELTLTNRDSMGYRMLLGREAMQGRVLVDPSESFLLGDRTTADITELYGAKLQQPSGLKIGVLGSNPELYSNQRLIEAAESKGHEVTFLTVSQCYMKLDVESLEIHSRGGSLLNNLDAVIPRISPAETFYGCSLTRHFESMGIYTLNGAEAIALSRDKLGSLQLLQRSGIQTPVSGFANSPTDTGDLIDMVGGAPLIIKLLDRSQGRGVILAETRKAAESAINAVKSLNSHLLVQEFVKEAQGKSLRCFVIDGKVVGATQRSALAGDFRANIHLGGVATVTKITKEERLLAIKAAKIMGLTVAGVDIIRSKKGPLLLGVNSSPGLESIETVTEKDIAAAIIDTIEKKLNWHGAGAVLAINPADK